MLLMLLVAPLVLSGDTMGILEETEFNIPSPSLVVLKLVIMCFGMAVVLFFSFRS